jgi:hypothetical protein
MKWMIRILSLLQALFVLSLWLFNEDVRATPTLAVLLQLLLTLILLAAWRWEKVGGLLAMSGGLIFFLVLIFSAVLGDRSALPAALVGSTLLALPYVVLGWLFFNLGRQVERASTDQTVR